MKSERVVVVDYDAAWPGRFEALRGRIWPALVDIALRVEHVGSTAVPGLAAKPIIDMTVVVAQRSDVPAVIERMATLGYRHQGTLGIEDRDAFAHGPDLPRHNLYVCPEGTIGVVNQVTFRDYLRAQPEAARRYDALKRQLAVQFATDIDGYVRGKTAFVLEALSRAGLSGGQLASIARANQ